MLTLTTMKHTPVKAIFLLVAVLLISGHNVLSETVNHGGYEYAKRTIDFMENVRVFTKTNTRVIPRRL